MGTQTMTSERTDRLSEHEIVSRADWLIACKDLLKREKELTRLRDQLAVDGVGSNYTDDSRSHF